MTTRTFAKTLIACCLTFSTLTAADFTWNGSVSSSWQEPANWTPAGVPSAADTVTVPAGKKPIELTNTWQVAAFNLAGGTVQGSGTLIVTAAFAWTAGALTGSGHLEIPAGATLAISGAGGKDLVGWSVEVSGNARWEGTGNIRSGEGAIIQIQPTGSFEIANDENIYYSFSGAPTVFNNAGVVRKTAGSSTTTLWCALNNDGTIEVQTGTLSSTSGGTSSGLFKVSAGATLEFNGGTYELKPASTIAGNGALALRSGTVKVAGTFSLTGTTAISGGTLDIASDVNLGGEITLSNGTLTGTGTVTHTGTFTWNGGTLSGTGALVIPDSATLVIGSASGKTLQSRTVSIAGTARWEGTGNISSGQGATVNVQPTGLFEISSDQVF
ncbi:MAG: hypothetical protein GX456_08730, partial [Verrucomicrobia bacterium]|nr:hypothetical protein [Verrucomicrobiota bacterium]